MKKKLSTSGLIDTPNLKLEWIEAVWDTVIFGYPVIQITQISAQTSNANHDFNIFNNDRNSLGCGLVSCRLYHEQLRESMLLEANDFRFIEMVYHPELDCLPVKAFTPDLSLKIDTANAADLPTVLEIAGNAFRSERFCVDPRIDSALSDQRYCNWINNSLSHATQRLYVIRDQLRIVAFFITELQTNGTCYWHLTAVAPDVQGQGY
ncbi:GNAT family N-acetyltransferase, partial [Chromatium okenii]|uniref:GNAT family N-acetyltransferase n=1 Tax=Chromatium okenii TaxID=61644 RepID=UPI0026EFCD3C